MLFHFLCLSFVSFFRCPSHFPAINSIVDMVEELERYSVGSSIRVDILRGEQVILRTENSFLFSCVFTPTLVGKDLRLLLSWSLRILIFYPVFGSSCRLVARFHLSPRIDRFWAFAVSPCHILWVLLILAGKVRFSFLPQKFPIWVELRTRSDKEFKRVQRWKWSEETLKWGW